MSTKPRSVAVNVKTKGGWSEIISKLVTRRVSGESPPTLPIFTSAKSTLLGYSCGDRTKNLRAASFASRSGYVGSSAFTTSLELLPGHDHRVNS